MQTISHRSRWTTACFIILGCTMEPKLPIEYETTHLRIGSELDVPLCNGDLIEYERIISNAEVELGLDMADQANVYIFTEEAWWSGANDSCGEGTLGCYNIKEHTINTTLGALEHEFIHAVARKNRAGEFFDQAIANIYSGDQTQFGQTAPSASIDLSGEIVDHHSASHFVRWLRERWGEKKLGELLREGGSGSSLFEKIYGMTIEDAEDLYFKEAPYQYSSLLSCNGSPLPYAPPRWQEMIDLDCPDGDDTRTYGNGMIVHRTFDILEPGYYTIHYSGLWFDIYRCSPDRVENAILPSTHLYDDVPPQHGLFPGGTYAHYEGQPSWSLYMETGKHDIGVGLLGHETGTVTLEITPTIGPHPLPPS